MATPRHAAKHDVITMRSTIVIALAVLLAYGVSWWLMPGSRPWVSFAAQPSNVASAAPKTNQRAQPAAQAENKVLSAETPGQPSAPVGQTDCVAKKCIALTFDDGPSSVTPRLLDILKAADVRASFFIIGRQVAGREPTIKRMQDEGHEIGNHSWDHLDFKKTPLDVVQDQVSRTDQALERVTGMRPRLVRPPYGSFGPEHLAMAGRPLILWNIDPDDWTAPDSNTIHDKVMQAARPGAIVISHDIYSATADAYARIVPELQQQGYSLVTVSDLLNLPTDSLPVQAFYYQ